jgi:hypothetical protein
MITTVKSAIVLIFFHFISQTPYVATRADGYPKHRLIVKISQTSEIEITKDASILSFISEKATAGKIKSFIKYIGDAL